MAKNTSPTFTSCLEIWFNWYQQKTGQSYAMDAKSGMHLKQLIKKIETKLKERGMEPSTINVMNSLSGLLNSITDQWILSNLEVSIINSKFNVIIAKAVKSNPFTVTDSIADALSRRRAEGAA